jgi:hypothetical protein|tara:strand:- start:55 stop:210 length:156 start_codon:yes stop_codon:yes gene_type:complete
METCHDEAWEAFRKHNKLTEDQLNELCWRQESGTLLAIEKQAQRMFEELCQ